MQWHQANNVNFHLTPIPEKSNTKFFGNTKKTPDFWPFTAHYAHFGGKMNFLKKLGCHFLGFTIICHRAKKKKKKKKKKRKKKKKKKKKTEKTNKQLSRKTLSLTDRQRT